MRATRIPTDDRNLGPMRSLAWQLHRSSGLEYDDLYAQCCLEYCIQQQKYKKGGPAKRSTYIYAAVKNGVINYIVKYLRHCHEPLNGKSLSYTPQYEFFKNVPHEVQAIIDKIMEMDEKQPNKPPKILRGIVRDALREGGWTGKRIQTAFRETKKFMEEMDIGLYNKV